MGYYVNSLQFLNIFDCFKIQKNSNTLSKQHGSNQSYNSHYACDYEFSFDIIVKPNPSGKSMNEDSYKIPVKFHSETHEESFTVPEFQEPLSLAPKSQELILLAPKSRELLSLASTFVHRHSLIEDEMVDDIYYSATIPGWQVFCIEMKAAQEKYSQLMNKTIVVQGMCTESFCLPSEQQLSEPHLSGFSQSDDLACSVQQLFGPHLSGSSQSVGLVACSAQQQLSESHLSGSLQPVGLAASEQSQLSGPQLSGSSHLAGLAFSEQLSESHLSGFSQSDDLVCSVQQLFGLILINNVTVFTSSGVPFDGQQAFLCCMYNLPLPVEITHLWAPLLPHVDPPRHPSRELHVVEFIDQLVSSSEQQLSALDSSGMAQTVDHAHLKRKEVVPYKSTVGSLSWLARNTNPEILYLLQNSVSRLSLFLGMHAHQVLSALCRKTPGTESVLTEESHHTVVAAAPSHCAELKRVDIIVAPSIYMELECVTASIRVAPSNSAELKRAVATVASSISAELEYATITAKSGISGERAAITVAPSNSAAEPERVTIMAEPAISEELECAAITTESSVFVELEHVSITIAPSISAELECAAITVESGISGERAAITAESGISAELEHVAITFAPSNSAAEPERVTIIAEPAISGELECAAITTESSISAELEHVSSAAESERVTIMAEPAVSEEHSAITVAPSISGELEYATITAAPSTSAEWKRASMTVVPNISAEFEPAVHMATSAERSIAGELEFACATIIAKPSIHALLVHAVCHTKLHLVPGKCLVVPWQHWCHLPAGIHLVRAIAGEVIAGA